MKKLLLLITLFGIIFLAILCKPSDNSTTAYKPPTDGTIVKMDGEDIPKKKDREAWLELMHQAGEGVDWRQIEIQNQKEQAQRKLQMRKKNGYVRNESEDVANGNLRGKWLERGSNNQAGSMRLVNYLVEDDMLYGISAGGSLWKGARDGSDWKVVNHDYTFLGDLVEARYLQDGTLRIIANLNAHPVYSDDGGITWTEAKGDISYGFMRDFVELDNGDMFVLSGRDVYRSQDDGENWERIQNFSSLIPNHLTLVRVGNTNQLMIIEKVNTNLSDVFLWNDELDAFDMVTSKSGIGFGSSTQANLNAIFAEDSLRLFVRNHENKLFVSLDTAKSWKWLSNLPTTPWSVGVYVFPSDHTKMMYGEVNPYGSITGGKFWSKTSDWSEYYGDIFTKLHADIMDIKEFRMADGTPFTIVCNHGGISQSFDHGKTFQNIGLINLNISQYYSVATHPSRREWIFAGSQDQGLQRGKIFEDNVASLDQVISGDYGHIVFSGEDENMWTAYPWGLVMYYEDPINQNPSAFWEVPFHNKSAWIPPLVSHPDKSQNAIFLAGGSMTSDNASHIIRLDISGGQITPTQLPKDFKEFGGDVSAIGINHFDHDEMYALTSTGVAYKSTNGGTTFESKNSGFPGANGAYGACIKPSKLDRDVVYISGSGYINPGVFKSVDGGETYEAMSEGLPPTMVFCIAPNEDESLIFAATEAGPFVYVADEEQWFDLSGVGTPSQTYWSVEYIEELQTARFGTFGRGIWDFEVEEQLVSTEEEIVSNTTRIEVYPNPFTDVIILNSGYNDLTNVTITDQQGRLVKKFTNQKIKNLSLDLSDLTNGIYFVTSIMNNRSVTEKIVKN
ncbi:MAG: T9SS type A sorting domain-containing protein [Bacteroidota bacterium]